MPAEPQMPRNSLPTDFSSGIHEVGNYKETTEGKTNHETDCMDAGMFLLKVVRENREERGGCEACGGEQKRVRQTVRRGIAFWYFPPNSARSGYATEGAL